MVSAQSLELTHEEQVYAIKTWRYLRLAMVALIVGLIAAIAYEWGKVSPNCFQTSISAYYYTPVHGYFVGALMAIGVCLFCLKGSTDAEDTLLNLAGIFAVIVALVPTPGTGSCASVLGTTHERDVNIANNVTALIVIGLLGLIILAVMALRDPPTGDERIGYGAAAVVWAVSALLFWGDRDFFVGKAHNTAAVLMFVCILIVVWLNALGYKEKTNADSPRNRYLAVGGAMIGCALGVGIAGALGWTHWVIAIEGSLIALFAVFWLIQTKELWREGLR
ncbi:MAG TPA: hypothetical protein VH683_02345 [Thermoleophilaceae bacterium]